ncbi:Saccharopine dehydrogenase-domain-containing protein [Clohesyomyces aquaticus]|uniref:Saccharopine dehydrogenase-domain-containing protein n=1 Tax=Clohesyomyces aquaticus TaxID=1231657 RepID=A0A1Y1YE06_9PLEO|nr:Saccharopine dehydrogenase-domain-containing protein [Clohesyomyces aquaticus]
MEPLAEIGSIVRTRVQSGESGNSEAIKTVDGYFPIPQAAGEELPSLLSTVSNMSWLFTCLILLPLPSIAFIVYRKLEYAHRAARSSSHGDCVVQKPTYIGVLNRWIKRRHLDVSLYHTLFLKHGRTFTTHPFMKPLVMTIEPENLKSILGTKFGEFDIGGVRETMGQQYMRQGAFTTQGSDWHVNSRTFIRPAFNKMTYAGLEYLERHFQRLLGAIPGDGQAFDIQPLLFNYTLNTISEMLFGASVDDLGYTDEDMHVFHEAEKCMRVKGLRAVHLSTLSNTAAGLYRSGELDSAAAVFHMFVGDMVDKGMEKYRVLEKSQRYALLHDSMGRTGGFTTSDGLGYKSTICRPGHWGTFRALAAAKDLAYKFSNTRAIALDVTNKEGLDKHIADHDVVISLIPFTHHAAVIKSAIKGKTHVVTTSYVSSAMRALDASAQQAGEKKNRKRDIGGYLH